MKQTQPINITEAQVSALEAITGFEGRGRQGLREDGVKAAGIDFRVLRNLTDHGLVGTRTRWGHTFYFVTRDGRRAFGA